MNEALEWFVRLQNRAQNPFLQQDFEAWRARSQEHVEAYDTVSRLWTSPALAEALARFDAPPLRKRRSHSFVWAAAASLLLCVSWVFQATGWIDAYRADYVTPVGGKERIVLADGSIVTLNTDTALAAIHGGSARGVKLLRGEAYFEVKPDPHRPFLVHTGQGSIRVVGTRFSVRSGAKVGVNVDSGIVVCRATTGTDLRLTAGQQAALSQQGAQRLDDADASLSTAWMKGRFVFRNRPLADVVDELERYHPGIIHVTDGRIAKLRITGNYKLADTGAIIRGLAELSGARVVHLSPYLTILKP